MKLLLDGKFAPVTSEIGFLRCSCETAVQVFHEWQQKIQQKRGVQLERSVVHGSLPEVIEKLFPLTSVERRRTLFIPTKTNWTAYFDNGWQGGDPASVVSYLSEAISCQGVRASFVPHKLDNDEGRDRGRYGAVIWEVYGPTKTDFLNTVRSVHVAYDGGKWVFDAVGIPQPMEELEQYKAKKIHDRFTPEMLDRYLRAMDIEAFSEEFYVTRQGAQLIAKRGPSAPAMKEYSLQEVQAAL